MSGSAVMTVRGAVDAADLGVTLPHEHLIVDTVREYRGDGLLHDAELAVEELTAFRAAGGGTLVELSTAEIGRAPETLRRISAGADVHVVMGCGHYRDPYLDRDWFDRTSVDAIAEQMVGEIREGVGDSGVRPGIIGEIGADRAFVSAAEERSFRAAARAHAATGLTITTHAARWPVGRAQLALLREEGVDAGRVIVGHCDTVPDPEYHLELAGAGCYVEFDTVGTGSEFDLRRIEQYVLALRSAGRLEQVLLSHDIFLRGHLRAHGGCGYAFLLEEFAPRLQRAGLTEDELRLVLVDNPRAALTGLR
jgi:predicted metal-dependent phosphotriesterase family hydrolase